MSVPGRRLPLVPYLDHAATTPVRPQVIAAVAEQMATVGNPSSLHTAGRAARQVVEESRESIAALLGARPSEVVFTATGTEADNIAVTGMLRARRASDPQRNRLIVSTVEHHAVLDVVEHAVAQDNALVSWAECDAEGRITPEALAAALAEHGGAGDAALASVMWANNEVGTINGIASLAAIAREAGVPFHTDAVQAVGHVPVDFAGSGADLLTLTGHKFGGPAGVGALLVRREITPVPLIHGGGQERQIRSGTLDVAGIRGLAVALELAVAEMEAEAQRLATLRDDLIARAMSVVDGIRVSGPHTPGDITGRLPANVHLRVEGCEGDSLLYLLDAAGIACSTGSACQAGVPRASHVLLAMGVPEVEARGSLRLTLGHSTRPEDIDAVIAALPPAVDRARRASARGMQRERQVTIPAADEQPRSA